MVPGHPGRVVPTHNLGGGKVDVRVFMDQNGNFQAAVQRISGSVSTAVVRGYDSRMPERVLGIVNDRRRRGPG
jgi:hypothetical protein